MIINKKTNDDHAWRIIAFLSDHSWHWLSQRETTSQWDVVSHWLNTYPERCLVAISSSSFKMSAVIDQSTDAAGRYMSLSLSSTLMFLRAFDVRRWDLLVHDGLIITSIIPVIVFIAQQLIILVVFGAADEPLAACMVVPFKVYVSFLNCNWSVGLV